MSSSRRGRNAAHHRVDILGHLRTAEIAYIQGDRRKVIRHLEVALQAAIVVRNARSVMGSLQKLPDWVQVGGPKAEWLGYPQHDVYVIVSVNRKPRGWSFVGERMDKFGTIQRMSFHQGAGKRFWRRYLG